jgi:hypothetical protein
MRAQPIRMQRYLAVIDTACGERFTFQFMQTFMVLTLAGAFAS